MKILITLMMILSFSASFADIRVKYIRRPDGTVIPIIREVQQKNTEEEKKGIGMTFAGDVRKSDNDVQAYVGSCGYVSLGRIESNDMIAAGTAKSDKEKMQEKLKNLKNGQRVSIKFRESGKCDVADWW